jgi:hypothetical protein
MAERHLQPERCGVSDASDICVRLRAEVVWEADVGALFEEAAREIETLRMALARLADQDATFSVIGGNMIVDVDAKLADDEQWAIREAIGAYNDNDDDEECARIAATLHGLLKRLG